MQVNLWVLVIALFSGAIAGIGVLKSRTWVLGLAFGLGIAQVIGWTVFPLISSGEAKEDWGATLWANFLVALMTVVPYTTIGAILVSGIIVWTRPRNQKRASN